MIKTKKDLEYYLLCDKIALGIEKKHPKIIGDRLWKFQIIYRKTEYHYNNKSNIMHRIIFLIDNVRFKRMQHQLCSEFPLNVFQEGLTIWHGQNIIVNGQAEVGRNFSISAGCCIGQAHDECPVIGDNVVMSIGSKILGGIHVADDVTIGAGALVVKDIKEPHTTWGGVPAKCISHSINQSIERKKERLASVLKYER